jgi:GNAT superfamily N-acetyltransferase
MHFIGFPKGLAITIGDVRRQIESGPDSEFGSLLIAELLETGLPMGQCKIGAPDEEGICEPDIKLKPEYWGNGYGKELWAALIDYAFTHPLAKIVQGTPNFANSASVRMQLGSVMVQVDGGVRLPESSGNHGVRWNPTKTERARHEKRETHPIQRSNIPANIGQHSQSCLRIRREGSHLMI